MAGDALGPVPGAAQKAELEAERREHAASPSAWRWALGVEHQARGSFSFFPSGLREQPGSPSVFFPSLAGYRKG